MKDQKVEEVEVEEIFWLLHNSIRSRKRGHAYLEVLTNLFKWACLSSSKEARLFS